MPKKPKKIPLAPSGLPFKKPTSDQPRTLSFSFKYLDRSHGKFSYSEKDQKYFSKLIERLSALCSLNSMDLLCSRSSSYRCHPIKWEETSESSFGIPNEEQLVDTPYQFEVSANSYGRIHGFFIQEVFHIVWMDPDHRLYP